MENNKISLERLAKYYVESQMGDKDVEIREALSEKLIDDVKSALYSENKSKIMKEVKKELDEKQEYDKIKKIRGLIIESFFVALLVGILGSQCNDIVSIVKGSLEIQYLDETLWSILLFGLITVAIFVFQYINSFLELFKQYKGKKSGSK